MQTTSSVETLGAVLENLRAHSAYARLPPRLAQTYPDLAERQEEDVHGVGARLQAIQSDLAGTNLGRMIDLGGNSGYFSLSLIDAGMAESSTVYDVFDEALAAGRGMAELLGIGAKISFVEQGLSLSFVQQLPRVDTLLCLNLLHHAGAHFEVDLVRERGWGWYAEEWLRAMSSSGQRAIVSLAFNRDRPVNWDEPFESQPRRFAEIADKAGWTVRYHANVNMLERQGATAAKDRFAPASSSFMDTVMKAALRAGNALPIRAAKDVLKQGLRRAGLLPAVRSLTGKTKYYHLYIFEKK